MMNNYYEIFKDDLQEFDDMTDKFHKGEIKVPEYKGFSGGYGSYAQRGGQKHMLRLRLPGGEIDRERFSYIS